MSRPVFVLGSGSPRRLTLLRRHGYRPLVRTARIDETPRPGEGALAYVRRMAVEKLAAVPSHADDVVLAADTVVHLVARLFGKPASPAEAVDMLAALSGGWHAVTTSFAARRGGEQRLGSVTTRVRFRSLEPAVIDGYVATGEPLDKAGAYGIQGVGAALVSEIEGSYTNVVGLPLVEVVRVLDALGLPDPLEEMPRESR